MVEALHKDGCGKPLPGVELVIEESNILGREWNTLGMTYGNLSIHGCTYDVSDWLRDPSRWNLSGTLVTIRSRGWRPLTPMSPRCRLELMAPLTVAVYPVDRAGYGIFEVPADSTQYTVELLIDGDVVPGSTETQQVPEPS